MGRIASRSAVAVVIMASSLGAQSVALPNTPAGRVMQAWLDAFNSGDTARMGAYVRQYDPQTAVANMADRRRTTGGFDVLTIERSEPRHLEFTAKGHTPTARTTFGTLEVSGAEPPQVTYFPLFTIFGPAPLSSIAVDATARSQAISGVIAQLDSFYVFPNVAKQIADSLGARAARGAYDRYTYGPVLAKALHDDVREISHDKHMAVNYSPNPIPVRPAGPPPEPTPEQRQQMQSQMDAENCGFQKVERLDGNIGYLKFNFFGDPLFCGATASAAMNLLAGTRALIVDMRENGGGSPAMVSYVTSYLFDDSTHLNDLWDRRSGNTTQYWTRPSVPGKKFGGTKPVFVLTSSRTFSGAEEYSYNLKSLKRATLVGETTGGGAHPVAGRRASEHFMIGVPGARAINPYTRTNWEGVGVEPDVKVPASDAMATALRLVAEKLNAPRPTASPPF
jgi:retinol-binding protein 3